jgi:serine/threonine-protein kinase RsbW
MSGNDVRTLAQEEWIMGLLAPELDIGFERVPSPRGVEIPSELIYMKNEIRQELMDFLSEHIRLNGHAMIVEMALEEILMNIIHHGNRRLSYLEGRIICSIEETREGTRLVLEAFDEGDLFDLNAVPDCTDPERLENLSGRGLDIIRKVARFTIDPPVPLERHGKVVRFSRPVVRADDGVFEFEPVDPSSDSGLTDAVAGESAGR